MRRHCLRGARKIKVEFRDFEEAQDKILLGAEREDKLSERDREVVAYHEAGHALMASFFLKPTRCRR